ncbi:MAG: ACP S-malonyltransferase [Bacteroidales bacterium]|nr:ACP S-malonyltransferase [Bacteroidales bacterium]
MNAYVFPGQGSQYPGMGRELYQSDKKAKALFDKADEILGFKITDIMFEGDAEQLKATKVTQPAVFLHSVIAALCSDIPDPDMVAGHSLGEFSALVACGVLSFEDALHLVSVRAQAMQMACEMVPGTMAAIMGGTMTPEMVEQVCTQSRGVVVPANYNSDAQIVISGEVESVNEACAALKELGVKRALPLQVGGAFHSPLMEPARLQLGQAIEQVNFSRARCPIYQNVDARPHEDPSEIKDNLLMQLTSPVRWTQTVRNMVAGGADSFLEIGPGTVLQNLVAKTCPEVSVAGIN